MVGEWSYKIYEEALSDSLISLGYEVIPYRYSSYFKTKKKFFLSKFFITFQNFFLVGPLIRKINSDILKINNKIKPDIIFLYRALHVNKRTIKLIKDVGDSPFVILYNNDNPFTSKYISSRFFLSLVPICDLVLAYRSRNIKEFYDLGAKKVLLFMSAFHPKINFPSLDSNVNKFDKKKKFDVVFVGHYEPDIRKEYLEEIVKRGISLRIFGSPKYWKKVQRKSKYLSKLPSIEVIDIDKYNEVISNSKIITQEDVLRFLLLKLYYYQNIQNFYQIFILKIKKLYFLGIKMK